MLRPYVLVFVTLLLIHAQAASCSEPANVRIGLSRIQITPTEPIRLSGYASRTKSSQGVADDLHARALVLAPAGDAGVKQALVLVSLDCILVTNKLTLKISNWVQSEFGIDRSQLVLSSTHSHAAPHLDGGLDNLYRQPSSPEQTERTKRYTELVAQQIQQVIRQAMAKLVVGKLEIGQAEATFAVNRRVLSNGRWTGFGEQTTGLVDHRVHILLAKSEAGELLGGTFLYACHCTTLGGDFNRVSGDWAGIAAARLEQRNPNSVFLPVIGCGADANPNPRGTYELAQRHAAELVDCVQSVVNSDTTAPIRTFPDTQFGYAGLVPEQPTQAMLDSMKQSDRTNDRRWAQHMLSVREEMGRLPESYPMPIHTWQFGTQLTWVFLGGEVVNDYQRRIENELKSEQTWVAAYCDDVFAYVASEAMRSEGGYEVDASMVYYLQPGRWTAGTQAMIVRRVVEILGGRQTEGRPLDAAEALNSMVVPDGFTVDLVAGEPLVQDPVNLAFGPDGRVWVVEMSDYPQGVEGGGRIKCLRDLDGDGTLDDSTVFLDGLSYPTSVMAWNEGILAIAAPDVFYAADRDDDGVADDRKTLLRGIGRANPQHRASGFELGLDGWIHFGAGDETREIFSEKNGQTYSISHRDVAWNPATGEIRPTSGHTQFVRARDEFGNWFGNSNSRPMYQYVIEDRYRSGSGVAGPSQQDLLTPAVAPPVLPRTKVTDRFNDLFALNRFTSACSSVVVRVPGLTDHDAKPDVRPMVGLICEPVHNLVARIEVSAAGSTFAARKHPADKDFEFLTSTDSWSRPVRVVNAPDGSIWVVDMVRKVIEHPEWIPTAWQQRLDLREGASLGRIYRVRSSSFAIQRLPELPAEGRDVLDALSSENGALRDMALERFLNNPLPIEAELRALSRSHASAAVRVAALGCLAAKSWLRQSDLTEFLGDQDPRCVRYALTHVENSGAIGPELKAAVGRIPGRSLGLDVDLQWVLTTTKLKDFDASDGLETIAKRCSDDTWIRRALALVSDEAAAFAVVRGLFHAWDGQKVVSTRDFSQTRRCVRTLWPQASTEKKVALANERLRAIANQQKATILPADLVLLSVLGQDDTRGAIDQTLVEEVVELARNRMLDNQLPLAERQALVHLLGSGLMAENQALDCVEKLLRQRPSTLRSAVIEGIQEFGSGRVGALLLQNWSRLSVGERSAAGMILLTRPEWTKALVEALENQLVRSRDLEQASIQQLRSYGDRNLRSRAIAVLGEPTPRSAVVSEFMGRLPPSNSMSAGEQLFQKHCAACHLSKANEPTLGPSLVNLKQWTLEQWVTAILDPNQNVEPKYFQVRVLTSGSQVFSGVVQQESEQAIQLALPDGSLRSFSRNEVDSIHPTRTSLMPEGMEEKLSPQDLANVIEFLRSQ